MSKATHNGTCQICGSSQALPGGRLAKHGYTVEHHFFEGVCPGANHLPLELDRAFADEVVVSLRLQSKNAARDAGLVEQGEILPTRAKSGQQERVQHPRLGYWQTRDVMVDYKDAPEQYQREAVKQLVWKKQQESKRAAQVAGDIERLADEVHGKRELQSRKQETAKREITVGTRVRLFGKNGYDVTVKALRMEVARGRGPNLNGQNLQHIVYERNGKEWSYPVRLIRQSAIIEEGK